MGAGKGTASFGGLGAVSYVAGRASVAVGSVGVNEVSAGGGLGDLGAVS